MCGIAGYIPTPGARVAPTLAPLLSRRLEHRGPDDHGFLRFGGEGVCLEREWSARRPSDDTVLVHRRLSILDLAPTGWQPMSTPDGRFHIAFNGEVYNYVELREELRALGHRFRSTSDTEVLLAGFAQWGCAVLPRLVGMFAFAVLDTRERTLTLARDFFGIKPLYYAVTPQGLVFASEIKAVLDFPGVEREVDAARTYEYLRFGLTDHGDGTLLQQVRQLPAAHHMVIPIDRPGAFRVERYWELSPEPVSISFTAAAERLRELFLESVRLHLRSDVPVGAALSGGIDSSAIVMAMRHLEPGLEIHAFSYIADDPALNEEEWIDLVGKAAGAVVHKVHPTAAEMVDDLGRLVEVQDEPFGGTSMYAQHRVFRLAAEAGIKVMLDGQGADEMLGGYPNYRGARLASLLRRGRLVQSARFARRAGALPSSPLKTLLTVAGGLLLPTSMQGAAQGLLGRELAPPWLNRAWFQARGVTFRVPRRGYGRDVLRARLRHTLTETSLPMLLRYEDRNSMAHSIESRVPFLTPALASFILSLPEEHIITPDGTTKAVFRAAMRGIVPDAVLDRRDKVGFATPERRWLGSLRPWVEGVLASETAARVAPLDVPRARHDWDELLAGRRPFDYRIWRWVNLIRWAEDQDVRFGEDGGAPAAGAAPRRAEPAVAA